MANIDVKPSLILVRGLPGSGKTTFALAVAQGKAPVFSADDYFMNEGKYEWVGSKLFAAHKFCEQETEDAMFGYVPIIYVANTFVKSRDMKAYFDLAEKYGYNVFTIVVENRHGSVNIHGVPDYTLSKYKSSFSIEL